MGLFVHDQNFHTSLIGTYPKTAQKQPALIISVGSLNRNNQLKPWYYNPPTPAKLQWPNAADNKWMTVMPPLTITKTDGYS